MRRGWFRRANFDLNGEPDAATRQLLERLVVIARVPITFLGEEAIIAESDMFERLRPGELAPEYTIIAHASFNEGLGDYEFVYAALRVPEDKSGPGGLTIVVHQP